MRGLQHLFFITITWSMGLLGQWAGNESVIDTKTNMEKDWTWLAYISQTSFSFSFIALD